MGEKFRVLTKIFLKIFFFNNGIEAYFDSLLVLFGGALGGALARSASFGLLLNGLLSALGAMDFSCVGGVWVGLTNVHIGFFLIDFFFLWGHNK